jgi:TRAP-type C4-dicarboxylate transport system permease small subunit
MSEPLPGAVGGVLLPPGPRRLLMQACQAYAMAGAAVFVGLVAMSIVSITGRKLFSAPVPGDVEVLQMLAAVAAASFFGYCHLIGGDVKVDFFTAQASPRVVHALDLLGSLLVALTGTLLAWRTGAGALVVKEAGENSMILDWPLWIPQMAIVPGFVLMALAGLAQAATHLKALRQGAAA